MTVQNDGVSRHMLPAGRMVAGVAIFVVSISLVIGGSRPARASAGQESMPAGPTSSQINAIEHDLLASSLPRTPDVVNGVAFDTFELGGGTSLSIPRETETSNSRLGGGKDPNLFITLNRTDQTALKNGAAAAIGTALCALPVVGWVACAGIYAAVAIAMTYVNAHGLCPAAKSQLKVYLNTGVFGCVK